VAQAEQAPCAAADVTLQAHQPIASHHLLPPTHTDKHLQVYKKNLRWRKAVELAKADK
jgi:hypothetical protein